MPLNCFYQSGWRRIPHDRILNEWVKQTLPIARQCVENPENARWLRYDGTWFAGVNVLPNDASGSVPGGCPLKGKAVEFIEHSLGFKSLDWDSGQVSVCYSGYPRPMDTESAAAFNYRLKRDAAHLDGLRPEGDQRRRHLREHHAFILGIPMVETSADASPLVIWEGSHEIIRETFRRSYQNLAPEDWGDVDVTDIYHHTRKEIFQHCSRIEIAALPGEAYVIHRQALHGVAPWGKQASSGKDGRMICYFRPELASPAQWLNLP